MLFNSLHIGALFLFNFEIFLYECIIIIQSWIVSSIKDDHWHEAIRLFIGLHVLSKCCHILGIAITKGLKKCLKSPETSSLRIFDSNIDCFG